MIRLSSWCPLAFVCLSLMMLPACESLPLLAPTDSTIVVVASAPVIPLEGESVITAVVTEGVGTPVQNGTLVTFSTTLGRLEPQESRTEDGRATTRLVGDKTTGTAMVSAFSGAATSNVLSIQIGLSSTATP